MLGLDRDLMRKLQQMHVRIDVPDVDTVILHDVPANRRFYSKPTTNVLLKKPLRNMPFMVCVDEDLEYTGPDAALARLFGRGIKRRGWRTLYMGRAATDEPACAAEDALAVLGYDGAAPALNAAGADVPQDHARATLIETFAADLSAMARAGRLDPTIARDDEADQAAACLLRWGQARMALLVGSAGVGKTNLFGAVTSRLLEVRPRWKVMLIDLSRPFAGSAFEAEAESVLAAILDQAADDGDIVLALDRIEQVVRMRRGQLLLADFLDAGGRVLAATLPECLKHFVNGPLGWRIHTVGVDEMAPGQTSKLLAALVGRLAEHHGVEIDPSCITACIRAADGLDGCFPAKAVTVLDAAAARASLTAGQIVGPDDVYFAAKSLQPIHCDE